MKDREQESKLIQACVKGERKAQHQLYNMFAPRMYVVAQRYCKSTQEAEDVIQDSFIKVFRELKNFRRESSLYHWIKRVVINTALNSQRSKLYMYPMVDVDELRSWSSPELTISGFHHEELLGMIQELPTGCQVIFNLYAIEGYQHKEIAKMLNISEGTSKSQYARAKELLRKAIEEAETVRYEHYKQ